LDHEDAFDDHCSNGISSADVLPWRLPKRQAAARGCAILQRGQKINPRGLSEFWRRFSRRPRVEPRVVSPRQSWRLNTADRSTGNPNTRVSKTIAPCSASRRICEPVRSLPRPSRIRATRPPLLTSRWACVNSLPSLRDSAKSSIVLRSNSSRRRPRNRPRVAAVLEPPPLASAEVLGSRRGRSHDHQPEYGWSELALLRFPDVPDGARLPWRRLQFAVRCILGGCVVRSPRQECARRRARRFSSTRRPVASASFLARLHRLSCCSRVRAQARSEKDSE